MDALLKELATAEDIEKRRAVAREALTLEKDEYLHIALLQPMFSWAMKKNVNAVVRPDNRLTLEWVTML